MTHASISAQWIEKLAEPYLRGYRVAACNNGSLHGYWFLSPKQPERKAKRAAPKTVPEGCGFFVGYLLNPGKFEFLKAQPPECLVFAFVTPVKGRIHQELVSTEAGLLPKTAKYIGWLTHRHPRFQFFGDQPIALVRHASMRDWPPDKLEHFSRNFFIETLAWLVRSALIRKLAVIEAASNRVHLTARKASPHPISFSRAQKRVN